MKRCWLLGIFFTLAIKSYGTSIFYPVALDTHLKILVQGKQEFLVTTSEVLRLHGQNKPKAIFGKKGITDAHLSQGQLWLTTADGVYIYSTQDFQLIKHLFANKKISAITSDESGKVWIATTFEGVYRQNSANVFEQQLNVAASYAICSTPDSSIWVGTNVGLYRINSNNMHITRYAEEGHSGYELPDNIVEQLYADKQSNMWVLMPDNISFKPGNYDEGELPSYSYIGTKDNHIKGIAFVEQASYLFATQKGVYLLLAAATATEHKHTASEIFNKHQTEAISLTENQLGTPSILRNEPIIFVEKVGRYFYFFTSQGGWKINERKLAKLLTLNNTSPH